MSSYVTYHMGSSSTDDRIVSALLTLDQRAPASTGLRPRGMEPDDGSAGGRLVVGVRSAPDAPEAAQLSAADKFRALLYIKDHPGAGFLDIANALGVSLGLAIEISDELVREGLVKRD